MNPKENKKNKSSSNSFVFGRWLQTKRISKDSDTKSQSVMCRDLTHDSTLA